MLNYKYNYKYLVNYKWIGILFFIIFSNFSNLYASMYIGTASNIKAAFLFHFTKFVTWPEEENKKDKLVIGVMANGEMLEALMALDGKKSSGMLIQIKPIDKCSLNNELNIKVLFLQNNFLCDRKQLVSFAIKNHILTISDQYDSTLDGIVISIYEIDNKIRFDINLKIAQKSKLILSSRLLSLARKVIE